MTSQIPDPTDVHVGNRLKQRRKLIGQTQAQLARACGITFQQVQKYERGANRVSASTLLRAARSQGVPVAYYFEGIDQDDADETLTDEQLEVKTWLTSPEAVTFGWALKPLDARMRLAVLLMAQSLATASAPHRDIVD